jgi:hypothetical protein
VTKPTGIRLIDPIETGAMLVKKKKAYATPRRDYGYPNIVIATGRLR